MANSDELDVTDEFEDAAKAAALAMGVVDRMKQEEDTLAAPVSFGQALRPPTTRLDLSRVPGVPLPASQPTPLQPVTIPLPTVTPSTTFEPMEEARRYGVPVDAIIRADAARRQFDAYQRLAAEGFTPEAVSKYGMFAFPSTSARGMQPQYRVVNGQLIGINPMGGVTQLTPPKATPPVIRAVPPNSNLVSYDPVTGKTTTVMEAKGPSAAQVTYNTLSDGSLDIQTTQPTGHVTHHVIRKGQSTLEKAAWMDLQQAIKEGDDAKIRDTISYIDSLTARRPSIPTRVGAPATSTGTEAPAPAPRTFKSEADALASGVKGIVIINGQRARID